MCLSNVYRNQIGDDNLLLSTVQRIESHGGRIVLTDILERQVTIEGELQMADLVDGKVIIVPKQD